MLDGIKIFCQSSIKISRDKTIYFDPYKIDKDYNDADIIFITHDHYDHYSPNDVEKVSKSNTMYVIPNTLYDSVLKLGIDKENILVVYPFKNYSICGIDFSTLPAYNIDKPYHPKSNNWLGYLINLDGFKYYIMGDTDNIDDVHSTNCDVLFIPVGGTYTMDYKEAAECANEIKPKVAIPIHYSTIVGSNNDALNFINLLDNIDGKILYKGNK